MELGGNSLPSGPDGVKRKVSYFYDPEIGSYYYGENHMMKPHRIRMTHDLLSKYNLLPLMDVYAPTKAEKEQLTMFHDDEYINYLSTITPEKAVVDEIKKLDGFGLSVVRGGDCPVFDDLYSYCQSYAGGSINCATMLNRKDCDIAINWSGGLHHAKKCCASGFCYVNDIVLAILELLKQHDRVLYIDIDVHHGDGVEEAFFTTERVMTVSFHKYHNFFPGTGNINDIGHEKGKYYSVNVPLDEGIDDHSYTTLFKKILGKVMEVYNPGAVVLQCGADSLSGDKLGPFNLSTKGHAECVKYMRSFNVPLLLLGGGGYKISSVARCWCYETAVAIGVEVDDKLPQHDYSAYYEPDDTLHVSACSNIKNKNKREILECLEQEILKNLSELRCAPSVQFQERSPDTHLPDAEEEDDDERCDPVESDMDVEQGDYDTMSDEFENPKLQGESSKLEAKDQKEAAVHKKGWTCGVPDLNEAYGEFL